MIIICKIFFCQYWGVICFITSSKILLKNFSSVSIKGFKPSDSNFRPEIARLNQFRILEKSLYDSLAAPRTLEKFVRGVTAYFKKLSFIHHQIKILSSSFVLFLSNIKYQESLLFIIFLCIGRV